MTSSEYPKTFTKESTGATVLAYTVDDEVRAKFNGYKEDVDTSDAYADEDETVAHLEPPKPGPTGRSTGTSLSFGRGDRA